MTPLRSMWLLPFVGLLLLAACGDDGVGPPPPIVGPPVPPRQLLVGGDISALARVEQAGGTFSDGVGGNTAIAALRSSGSNTFRLRLFLAPNGDEVQVNDLAYTIALAKRVRASGATLMLDFHYSDTWADPGHQVIPAAWAGLSIDSLEARVEQYTAFVLDTLRDEGALPTLVQVGNEIDGGLLWPLGRIGAPGFNDSTAYNRFGRLLRAGVRGVRGATTPADSVRIIIHFAQGANIPATEWFYDLIQAQGVEYDIIGLSYYPWWHGTVAQLRANLSAAALRYGKSVMVVEAAYPWRSGWDHGGSNTAAMTWPLTAEGQRAYLRDVVNAVRDVPSARGLGVIWWYPEAIQVPGLFVWGGGALALFDQTGRVLPAARIFRETNGG